MAFGGYLMQFGSQRLPLDLVQLGTYNITPDQRQDLDSYRDNNGVLHRNVLGHTASKIEFQTTPMRESDKVRLMNLLTGHFTNEKERKLDAGYYDPVSSEYKTGTFYMPDPQFTLYTIDEHGELWYDSFRLAFIEY